MNNFIKSARSIHNDKYIYYNFDYKNSKQIIKIACKIHGDFLQSISNHLKGYGCKKCGYEKTSSKKKMTIERFLEKANKTHNNKYLYNYTILGNTTKEKVKITCKKHGIFEQSVDNHIRGRGCPKCGTIICPWSRKEWVNKAEKRPGILYVIRCWNDNEEFLKFGITFQKNIKSRYGNCNSVKMPYNYELIYNFTNNNLEFIWELEKIFKICIKKENIYKPLINFQGMTEVYKPVDINKEIYRLNNAEKVLYDKL